MADAFIGIDEPGTIDKRVDCESLTVAAQTVHRERMQVAGALAAEIAVVANADPGGSAYGLVIRQAGAAQAVGAAAHDAAVAGNPLLLAGYASAAAPTDVSADGDAVRLWADRAGRLQVGDGGGTLSIDDGGGAVTVDGSVSLAAAIPAGTNNIGDVDVLSLPALPAGNNNIGDVDVASIGAGVIVEVQGDVAHDAVAAGNPVLMGGFASAAAPTDVSADGDAVRAWFDRAGRQAVFDGGGSLTVDGSVSLAAALPAGTNNIGDVDVLSLPALPAGTNNIGDVDVASIAAGVLVEVQGDVAHDAAAAGNPVLMGAYASLNEPAAVSADADAVRLWADRHGRQVVLAGHANPETPVTVNATASGGTSVIGAPGGGVSIYVCKGSIVNRAATNRLAGLRAGTGGANVMQAECAAEGGGYLFDFGSRGWRVGDNVALAVGLDATGDVDVNITEYYLAAA